MSELVVLSPGVFATIQDAGRFGHLRYGVTEGGGLDSFSLRHGQHLLGNRLECAAIEVAMGGCSLQTTVATHVVVTGALLPITVDGDARTHGKVFKIEAGQRLALGHVISGVYSYISVAGGILSSKALGSRSTVVRDNLGGLNGTALQANDRLPISQQAFNGISRRGPVPKFPQRNKTLRLRYIPGFQYSQIAADAIAQFEKQTYQLTGQKDRMGARLQGDSVETGISQLYSEATCLGAVQIPPDGQPIVLLNDRQTVGGYPKIGGVIPTDCRRLVQATTGTAIQFSPITPEQADQVAWLEKNYESELSTRLTEAPR